MSWVVAILLVLGAFFAFVAALGVYRFPEFYSRMHAATKAGAFGASLMLAAVGLNFGSFRAVFTACVIITFFYLTTPVAAQSLAQAAYRKGIPLWPKDGKDALAEDEKGDA